MTVLKPHSGAAKPGRISLWIAGARPRTLPAAVVPVILGTTSAYYTHPNIEVSWWKAISAMVVALALQIGTNYANDYSDGIRGTDIDRVGPLRLVGSGLVRAPLVKRAAFISFGVAALFGLAISISVGYELILVGITSIAAGWFYTGGSKPYGYAGFGELFVFIFFGLVATLGSAYIQNTALTYTTLILAIATGAFATALLITNNLRDIEGDAASNKVTLALRLGDKATRWFYYTLMAIPFVITVVLSVDDPLLAISFLALIPARQAIRIVLGGAEKIGLIPALAVTAKTQLLWGLLISASMVISKQCWLTSC